MSGITRNYIIDEPIPVDGIAWYMSIRKHRIIGYNASTWIITIKEEFQCFVSAHLEEWINNDDMWGIHMIENKLEILGQLENGEDSKIAKFKLSNTQNLWHGYPADYKSKIKDRPPDKVLSSWRLKGIITKSHMSKIRGGKPCRL